MHWSCRTAILITFPSWISRLPGKKSPNIPFNDFTHTGQGIPQDRLKTIFVDFKSTKRNGLGIGLPLTKIFVEEMDGQIGVNSQEGNGTTFILSFPRISSYLNNMNKLLFFCPFSHLNNLSWFHRIGLIFIL